MGRPRKDGKPVDHKGGRPTKAEEMGLEKHLNSAYQKLSKGKLDGTPGAEAILQLMWNKASKGEYKAIEWIAHRYYGREPKAIIQEIKATGDFKFVLAEHLKTAFDDGINTTGQPSKTKPDIQGPTDE